MDSGRGIGGDGGGGRGGVGEGGGGLAEKGGCTGGDPLRGGGESGDLGLMGLALDGGDHLAGLVSSPAVENLGLSASGCGGRGRWWVCRIGGGDRSIGGMR